MNAYSTVKDTFRTFAKELTLIGTFFIVALTISNLAYKLFDFRLLPIVKGGFDAFHTWCHWVLSVMVFSWLIPALQSLCYGFSWILAQILPVDLWWPNITIPPLMADLSLVSIAFTRVFQNVDLIVPRSKRAEAEGQMTEDGWGAIESAEGRFWGPLHRFLERMNRWIWVSIDALTNIICFAVPKLKPVVKSVLMVLAGCTLFWGFIRLAGYAINVSAAGRLCLPIMTVRKQFFRYFGLTLLGASIAAAIFILLNGWLAEYLAL